MLPTANQLTGFYMSTKLAFNGLKKEKKHNKNTNNQCPIL